MCFKYSSKHQLLKMFNAHDTYINEKGNLFVNYAVKDNVNTC